MNFDFKSEDLICDTVTRFVKIKYKLIVTKRRFHCLCFFVAIRIVNQKPRFSRLPNSQNVPSMHLVESSCALLHMNGLIPREAWTERWLDSGGSIVQLFDL